MTRLKKSILILLTVALVGAGCIYAYFTYGDTAQNDIGIGGNTSEITEEFPDPGTPEPGDSFTKDVKVTNKGTNDAYVRVKALFSNSDMEQYCSLDLNEDDWEYNSWDNYYYYKNVLKAGDTTPSLFTTVTINKDAPETELTDFDIIVYSESYQSEGFDDYEDAWTHFQLNKNERLEKEVIG